MSRCISAINSLTHWKVCGLHLGVLRAHAARLPGMTQPVHAGRGWGPRRWSESSSWRSQSPISSSSGFSPTWCSTARSPITSRCCGRAWRRKPEWPINVLDPPTAFIRQFLTGDAVGPLTMDAWPAVGRPSRTRTAAVGGRPNRAPRGGASRPPTL